CARSLLSAMDFW
nr:immunoglobulin heavy chain junction region [Mus musculus]MBK4184262.1 immunoglobulin heavy chain junction region [Mus musculus]MBK4184264.1 immunoglobulin heavy chain junction region [Mus musculus]MBK4184265.1 immunoglobulin heavy chain junction region [Mus musculus]MBK4184266.1 immunoglobulin heavy chain junction region [Mus musculus]